MSYSNDYVVNGGNAKRRTRVYVDVSVISRVDSRTGIQRVVRSIWNELNRVDAEFFEIIPVAGSRGGVYRKIPQDFLSAPLKRLPLPLGRRRIRPGQGDVFLGLDLAAHIIPRNHRQLKSWRAAGMRFVAIVYDLLPLHHPEWFNSRAVDHFGKWMTELALSADALACISATVAGDVRNWLQHHRCHLDRPTVSAITLGANIAASAPSFGLPSDWEETVAWVQSAHTILIVGTIEPRKGHAQALAAFDMLWAAEPDSKWQLLIVGRGGWKTQELQQRIMGHSAYGTSLKWIDNASDEYLELLYAACSGVLMSSRGEGLGLPLLEAAQRRKPILARDLPVFREIAPDGVCFFTGDLPEEMMAALCHWRATGLASRPDTCNTSWRLTVQQLLHIATHLPLEDLEYAWRPSQEGEAGPLVGAPLPQSQ